MNTVSILVAHAHPIMARALRGLLQVQPGWEVVAEAINGSDALVQAQNLRPHVAILDAKLPRISGLAAARLILQSLPEAKILLLGEQVTELLIANAYRVGVRGYVTTAEAEKDLVDAINELLVGGIFMTGEALHYWHKQERPGSLENGHSSLSARETEILQFLVEGYTNREVAGLLGLSPRTVDNHRSQIMQKLKLRNVCDLVRHAVRQGIIEP